jgi:16S rRNA (uracil1498-N3)-methyltransferase
MWPATDGRHRIFFAPQPWPAAGGTLMLPECESRHARAALRLKPGDALTLLDGEGHVGEARLVGRRGRRLAVRLEQITQRSAGPGPALALALPLLRSPARIDWVIEKGTELGVRAFHLYPAARSVKRDIARAEGKASRWLELARAAMKQSGRADCPHVVLHGALGEILAGLPAGAPVVLADPEGEPAHALARLECDSAAWLLVVGPEGGFAPEEDALLGKSGVLRLSLGRHRLRSETAAVALVALAASAMEKGT